MKNLFCVLSLLFTGLVDSCELSSTQPAAPVQIPNSLIELTLSDPSVGSKYVEDIFALGIPEFGAVKYLDGHLFRSPYSNGFIRGKDEGKKEFKAIYEKFYKEGLTKLFEQQNYKVFVIVEAGKAIGIIWEDGSQTDYFVHPSKAGKGYATFALSQYIKKRIFEEKIDKFCVFIHPANIASLKVFAKVTNLFSDIVCTSCFDFSKHPVEIGSADLNKIITANFTEDGSGSLVTSMDCSSFSTVLKSFVMMQSVGICVKKKTVKE